MCAAIFARIVSYCTIRNICVQYCQYAIAILSQKPALCNEWFPFSPYILLILRKIYATEINKRGAGQKSRSPQCDRVVCTRPDADGTVRWGASIWSYDWKMLKGRRYIYVQTKRKRFWNQRFQNLFGGDKRDRTADLLNAIQALSQLSYTPICCCRLAVDLLSIA